MTLDAHVTGIWCGQIGGGVGNITNVGSTKPAQHRGTGHE